MLYVLYKGHESYRGGQNEILHLVSTVGRAIDCGHGYAFTDRHADLGYAEYFNDVVDEDRVDWQVMPLHYWSNDNETKERRQAEFLVYDWFPWGAIDEIGVIDAAMLQRVQVLLTNFAHRPAVRARPDWYY